MIWSGDRRDTQKITSAARAISLEFKGFWRVPDIANIPRAPGIYVVYECKYYEHFKHFFITNLLYIGEAEDVGGRIAGHEKWPLWKKECEYGRELCFSFAANAGSNRKRVEAALIHEHKPPVNDEYTKTYPFDDTTVFLRGKVDLLHILFRVRKSD